MLNSIEKLEYLESDDSAVTTTTSSEETSVSTTEKYINQNFAAESQTSSQLDTKALSSQSKSLLVPLNSCQEQKSSTSVPSNSDTLVKQQPNKSWISSSLYFPLVLDELKPAQEGPSLDDIGLADMGYKYNEISHWNISPQSDKPNLYQLLKDMIENHVRPNVQVRIGAKGYNCHMMVLQCYSQFFLKFCTEEVVKLPEEKVSTRAFELIYAWMMKDKPIIPRKGIVELFQAAMFLQIKDLVHYCWTIFDDEVLLSEENAFMLYLEAHHHYLNDLEWPMLGRIRRFFLPLVSSREFLLLTGSELAKLFTSDSLGVNSEIEVFLAAVRWFSDNWEERKAYVVDVMKNVRFGLIPGCFLVQMQRDVQWHEVYRITSNAEVVKLIQDGLAYSTTVEYHGFDSKEFEWFLHRYHMKRLAQRNWLYDSKCSYHHSPQCPKKKIVTYLAFVEYLSQVQKLGKAHWANIEYLGNDTVYAKPCCVEAKNNEKLKDIKKPQANQSHQKDGGSGQENNGNHRIENLHQNINTLSNMISNKGDRGVQGDQIKQQFRKIIEDVHEHISTHSIPIKIVNLRSAGRRHDTPYRKQTTSMSRMQHQPSTSRGHQHERLENISEDSDEEHFHSKEGAGVLLKNFNRKLGHEIRKEKNKKVLQQLQPHPVEAALSYEQSAQQQQCQPQPCHLKRPLEPGSLRQPAKQQTATNMTTAKNRTHVGRGLEPGFQPVEVTTQEGLLYFSQHTMRRVPDVSTPRPVRLEGGLDLSPPQRNAMRSDVNQKGEVTVQHRANDEISKKMVPSITLSEFEQLPDPKILLFGGYNPFNKPQNQSDDECSTYSVDDNVYDKVLCYDSQYKAWKMLASTPFDSRQHHGAIRCNGKIYIVGGTRHDRDTFSQMPILEKSVWTFDPNTLDWNFETNIPESRRDFAAIVLEDECENCKGIKGKRPVSGFFIIGGEGPNCTPLKSVWFYDVDEKEWIEKAPLNQGRFGHSAVLINNKIWVAGGMTDGSYGRFLTTTMEYLSLACTEDASSDDLSTSSGSVCGNSSVERGWRWTVANVYLRVPRLYGKMARMSNNDVYFIAGIGSKHDSQAASINDIDYLDMEECEWEHCASLNKPRHAHDVVVHGDSIFVIGGVNTWIEQALAKVETFNTVTKISEELCDLPYPVSGAAVVLWN